jgi:hypothetical protein
MPYKRQYYDPFIEAPAAPVAEEEPTEMAGFQVAKAGTYVRLEDVSAWLRGEALAAHSQGRAGPWREALEAAASALEQAAQP